MSDRDAPSYRDLFEVHLRYADYIRAKSLVIHQYVKNVAASGTGVELEVRQLIRSILPDRYKVTSGYIVSATSRGATPKVSPQLDVLIVDTLVPHSLWVVDSDQGIEIVPLESVVGVIEVKRTLDNASIKNAISHLRKVVTAVGIRKDDDTVMMPGGIVLSNSLRGHLRSNPLLGVIGLIGAESFASEPGRTFRDAIVAEAEPQLILDFALAMSGTFCATATGIDSNYAPIAVQSTLSPHWAEAKSDDRQGSRIALAQGMGFIQAYIGQVCGRVANADYYFFNESIR